MTQWKPLQVHRQCVSVGLHHRTGCDESGDRALAAPEGPTEQASLGNELHSQAVEEAVLSDGPLLSALVDAKSEFVVC